MKFYSVKEVAEILGLNSETIKRYIYREKLLAYKIANEWRISEEDLEDFVYRNPSKEKK